MTRIEEEETVGSSLDSAELQAAIKREAKKLRPKKQVIKKRPLFGCFNCLVVLLIIIALLLAWGLSAVAKSGLIEIPFISNWVYSDPEPLHQVTVEKTGEIDLEKAIGDELASSVDTTITFTEEELTLILQQGIETINTIQSKFVAESGQVAIESQQAEIFLKVSSPLDGYLIIGFIPLIQNQNLYLEVQTVKLGNLEIPNSWGQELLDKTVNKELNKALDESPVILEEVTLVMGKMLVDFDIQAK